MTNRFPKPLSNVLTLSRFIDANKQRMHMTDKGLAAASGWSEASLIAGLAGGAVGFQPLADMLQVVGYRLVPEAIDDLLPLSLDALRMITR